MEQNRLSVTVHSKQDALELIEKFKGTNSVLDITIEEELMTFNEKRMKKGLSPIKDDLALSISDAMNHMSVTIRDDVLAKVVDKGLKYPDTPEDKKEAVIANVGKVDIIVDVHNYSEADEMIRHYQGENINLYIRFM